MQIELIDFQFSLSTAEDERNYFSGITPTPPPEVRLEEAMPPGIYRIIDGEAYRVVPGVPIVE